MRRMVHWLAFLGGLGLCIAALGLGPPTFDLAAKREWNRCKQERRVATLNHTYPVSARCRQLGDDLNRAMLLFAGGLVLLVVARAIKPRTERR